MKALNLMTKFLVEGNSDANLGESSKATLTGGHYKVSKKITQAGVGLRVGREISFLFTIRSKAK